MSQLHSCELPILACAIKGYLLQVDWPSLADDLSVLVNSCWNWNHGKCHESKEGVTPSITKSAVHLWSGKRQDTSKNGSCDGESSNGRSSVLWESVDHVGLNWDKYTHHSEAERHHADDWNDPVDLVVDGPSVPEEGNRDEAGEEHAGWETHLRLEDTAVGEGHLDDSLVGDLGNGGDTEEEPDTNTEIGKTGNLRRPSVRGLEDSGNGGEKKVEKTVDESHVDGHQCCNSRLDEHLHWSNDTMPEDLSRWLWNVGILVAGAELRVVHLLAEPLSLAAHENAVVGLLVEDLNTARNDTGCHEKNPIDPSPSSTLRDETTANWPDDWSKEWSEGEDGGSESTLVWLEEIGNNSTSNGDTSRSSNACKETKDDKRADVWCQSTPNLPDDKEEVGTGQDDATSINLRKRREEQWSESIAQDENGHRECCQNLRLVAELSAHETDTWCEHRGCQWGDEGDGGNEDEKHELLLLGKVEWHVWVVLSLPSNNLVVQLLLRYRNWWNALLGCRYARQGPRDSAAAGV